MRTFIDAETIKFAPKIPDNAVIYRDVEDAVPYNQIQNPIDAETIDFNPQKSPTTPTGSGTPDSEFRGASKY